MISGRIEARKITVPEGATVRYEGHATMHSEWICVHGDLVGVTPHASGPPPGVALGDVVVDAPRLHLPATREVHVEAGSTVRGADAPSMVDWPAEFERLTAGRGGDVFVDSPYSLIDGVVVGGSGGDAAPGGAGGEGGGAYFAGISETTALDDGGGFVGGAGGMGGTGRNADLVDGVLVPALPPGAAGAGGDAGGLDDTPGDLAGAR